MKNFGKFMAVAAFGVLTAFPLRSATAQVTSGTVDVNGATIAYRVQGSGPALFLVHGFPLSGELFSHNRAALARKYRVVTPDLRGFGMSKTPLQTGPTPAI